ncbi:NAD(P)H-hydrate dehydratase [Dactylosporangium vinaceum]|uniref:ADP-dependent (S)-NAD(P)H-hydrate dehydratase n=1 Tax=Dactylosporangium vinaceum TaxID=53362 RepID=A0ABV5M9S4_9ACTN|nr:NAD(P)H-hydrate dehydratase [Dactylosporangium vinaceum]UAB93180.1 NAD(P)H-hydrate dehydratase [Dactylosporangium vinaceum]
MPTPSEPRVITPYLLRDWPLPAAIGGDKHDRGTVLVVGGSRNTPGGVLLAGVAALRAGAGRLQLAVGESTATALSIAVPEAKVLGLPETASGSVSADLPDELLELVGQADAVALGPGLDNIEETEKILAAVLPQAGPDTAMVLDAYALGALSRSPAKLGTAVLTPNRTEAGHLLGRDVGPDLAAETAALAARYGAAVTLHGHIADPAGSVWREESGAEGLGTSGSGDVLSGLVAGLLARGAQPAQAACWATYAHAVAGQRLAPRFGRTGYLARELLDEVAYTIGTVSL